MKGNVHCLFEMKGKWDLRVRRENRGEKEGNTREEEGKRMKKKKREGRKEE